jgi:hypothetical protein
VRGVGFRAPSPLGECVHEPHAASVLAVAALSQDGGLQISVVDGDPDRGERFTDSQP